MRRSHVQGGKALTGLMLSVALLALAGGVAGCGQKRPLQLPSKTGTGAATTPVPKADPASAPASAAVMPQR